MSTLNARCALMPRMRFSSSRSQRSPVGAPKLYCSLKLPVVWFICVMPPGMSYGSACMILRTMSQVIFVSRRGRSSRSRCQMGERSLM